MATHDSDMKKNPVGSSTPKRGKGAAAPGKTTQTSKSGAGSKSSAAAKDKGMEGTGRKGGSKM